MDPKKTGAFIAALRKELGLTQKELSEKLHVSDKAISRWETGKGFPETGLLKPLSDTLGVSVGELLSGERMEQAQVKEQTDKVIVQSLKKSEKSTSAMVATVVCSVAVVLLVVILAVSALPKELSAMEFIQNSNTKMLYHLGADNANPHTEYGGFLYREFEGGYEYYTPDGTERYVFTHIPEYSEEPVLTYMHCSAQGSPLFGVLIGESTQVDENTVLGVEKDYSLREYLKDQGFQLGYEEFQYGRRSLVYINEERCNWYFYYKENVFVHVLISAHEGGRLLGYDIGILDENLESILQEQMHGYRLIIEDPYHLVKSNVEEVQMAGTPITLYAMKPPEEYEKLYLYVNGECVGEFSDTGDWIWSKTATFKMLAQETTVLITPEKQHD